VRAGAEGPRRAADGWLLGSAPGRCTGGAAPFGHTPAQEVLLFPQWGGLHETGLTPLSNESRQWMESQGVAAPRRMLQLLTPGLECAHVTDAPSAPGAVAT